MTRQSPEPTVSATDTTKTSHAVDRTGGVGSDSSEWDAFEKLARKLVAVPKEEIDAERAKKA